MVLWAVLQPRLQMYVSGNYAYVLGNYPGSGTTIQTIDISNPASPVTIGTAVSCPGAGNMYLAGHYVYVTDTVGLQIFDISNPYNIT